MTDDLMNKAKDQMNVLERVVAGVPGYKGYKEKEQRRETDKTLRMVLTRQIEDQKMRLTELQLTLISGGQLGLMDDMKRCATKMQILADSIRTASYGYAPLFDDISVKEAELDALAQFDEGLAAGVERIKIIIDTMGTLAGRPDQDWMESNRALNNTVENLVTEFGHRHELILQVAPAANESQAES